MQPKADCIYKITKICHFLFQCLCPSTAINKIPSTYLPSAVRSLFPRRRVCHWGDWTAAPPSVGGHCCVLQDVWQYAANAREISLHVQSQRLVQGRGDYIEFKILIFQKKIADLSIKNWDTNWGKYLSSWEPVYMEWQFRTNKWGHTYLINFLKILYM